MLKRGKPEENAPIHLMLTAKERIHLGNVEFTTEQNTMCNTGNYHINHTRYINHVTCEKCLELFKKKGYKLCLK